MFLAERTAGTKALRPEHACHGPRGARNPFYLEWRELGETGGGRGGMGASLAWRAGSQVCRIFLARILTDFCFKHIGFQRKYRILQFRWPGYLSGAGIYRAPTVTQTLAQGPSWPFFPFAS